MTSSTTPAASASNTGSPGTAPFITVFLGVSVLVALGMVLLGGERAHANVILKHLGLSAYLAGATFLGSRVWGHLGPALLVAVTSVVVWGALGSVALGAVVLLGTLAL
ncbi:MAG: hypothetical protein AB2A00_39380, partial [Myxococcota bacterium]